MEEPELEGSDIDDSMNAICKLDMDEGCQGSEEISRWYFNAKRSVCVPFVYTGCGGNR